MTYISNTGVGEPGATGQCGCVTAYCELTHCNKEKHKQENWTVHICKLFFVPKTFLVFPTSNDFLVRNYSIYTTLFLLLVFGTKMSGILCRQGVNYLTSLLKVFTELQVLSEVFLTEALNSQNFRKAEIKYWCPNERKKYLKVDHDLNNPIHLKHVSWY